MNREQLAELLADAIIDSDTLDGFSMNWHEKAATELVDKLWPVLDEVWSEGADAGEYWAGVRAGRGPRPRNPYGEAPR